ncbi:MAG: sulfotransferase family protein [Angustibacter sp.]
MTQFTAAGADDSAPQIPPTRLIFVAGLHRSGTTPLTRALATHEEISGLTATGVLEDEGQHLQSVYPAARTYGGPGRFARDPRAHLTEDSALVSPVNAERLLRAWAPYWRLERQFLVEKSPPNLLMGRFLQALFPGSAYVAVLRHPIVVALSTHKWRRLWSKNWQNHTSLATMVDHWLVAHDIFAQDLPRLQRALVLRYEDLVDQPATELGRVQGLLGLSHGFSSAGIRPSSDQYEQRWRDLATGLPWERRARRRLIERFAEPLARYGYDVEDLRARPTRPFDPEFIGS